MTDLMGKNAAALEQALREMAARVVAQDARIAGLAATVGGLIQRMDAMEAAASQRRAREAGHGPTAR